MDNFFVDIQSIKSHIDDMSQQITKIISQYNSFQSQTDQLINLGIQMLNTGIYSFNLGKKQSISSLDYYYIQLKNISEQINNIIKLNETSLQQNMMQEQIMQDQIINQIDIDNYVEFDQSIFISDEKKNITFELLDGNKINLILNNGIKIKDIFDEFEKRILKSKYNFNFILNGQILDYNDETLIDILPDRTVIKAVEYKVYINYNC